MRIRGFVLAAGLALAGLGGVANAQNSAAPASAPTPAAAMAPQPAAKMVAPVAALTPTPAAAPASPLLAQDGAPAVTIDPVIGHPVDGKITLQPQVTRNGERARNMHDRILVPVITAISALVLILLLVVILRFRAGANPTPSKTSHNTTLEVVWTLVPVILLVLIAIPSIGLLQAQFKPPPKGAVTLKAIGNQWYWSYQYPDNGGLEITANMLREANQVGKGERARTDADGPRLLATDNRVVLPVGVPIRLITTSNDVIHSWGVPAFWIKLDAVPGRLNETSFTIERPGIYFGVCSELCGARHAYMPIAVEAVPPATFAAWVKAKGGTMPGAPVAAPPHEPSPAAAPQPAGGFAPPAPTEAATAAPIVTNQSAGSPSANSGK